MKQKVGRNLLWLCCHQQQVRLKGNPLSACRDGAGGWRRQQLEPRRENENMELFPGFPGACADAAAPGQVSHLREMQLLLLMEAATHKMCVKSFLLSWGRAELTIKTPDPRVYRLIFQ